MKHKKYKLLKDTPFTKAGAFILPVNFDKEAFVFENCVSNDFFFSSQPEWFEPVIEKAEPEYEVRSPALISCSLGRPYVGANLFKSASEAEEFIRKELLISWPAHNAQGEPIQYRVPVRKR